MEGKAAYGMLCLKGQDLHLEELVIKTQQELVNVRIEDKLCGQAIKGKILKIQDIVHVLKLSEMLTSNCSPSYTILTRPVFVRELEAGLRLALSAISLQ
ncbi:hypothetical protein TURU_086461 [Turdus rufiventris]|nr:hypothetical protein TURU_086461 [Turdus rufiventris]